MVGQLWLGTAGWSYKDWVGPFYEDGTKAADMLALYSRRFRCVEIDSSFYGMPSLRAVKSWKAKAPIGFLFSPKVPKTITHEKLLDGVEEELTEFVRRMRELGNNLGPLLLQFRYFKKAEKFGLSEFLARLDPFLALFRQVAGDELRIAVEVRNKTFYKKGLFDTLAVHGAALGIIDHPWMPPPEDLYGREELLTSSFGYVRFLGDRYGIERVTKTWNREVLDQTWRLEAWARWMREVLVERELFAFANNHFSGFAPAAIEKLGSILDG